MKHIILTLLVVLTFTACNKEEDKEPEQQQQQTTENQDYLENAKVTDFYPLAVGNSWTYEVYKYKLANSYQDQEYVGEQTVSIASTDHQGGFEYFVHQYDERKDQIPEMVKLDNEKQLSSNSATFLSLYLGKSIASGAVRNYGSHSVNVRRKDGSFEVPAGEFDKLINRRTDFSSDGQGKPSLSLNDYYAKGVGRIYFEDIDVEGCLCNGGTPVVYVYKLKSYNLQ